MLIFGIFFVCCFFDMAVFVRNMDDRLPERVKRFKEGLKIAGIGCVLNLNRRL